MHVLDAMLSCQIFTWSMSNDRTGGFIFPSCIFNHAQHMAPCWQQHFLMMYCVYMAFVNMGISFAIYWLHICIPCPRIQDGYVWLSISCVHLACNVDKHIHLVTVFINSIISVKYNSDFWIWNKKNNPDSNAHGANMGPTWGRQNPGGPHVGHMNFVIWERVHKAFLYDIC